MCDVVLKNCLWCGDEFEARVTDINRGWAKCCSHSCAAKLSNSLRPEGKSRSKTRQRARNIYMKHNGLPTCQHCGAIPADVHHMDEDVNNNDLDNLQALCRSCHIKYHNHVSPKRQKKAA